MGFGHSILGVSVLGTLVQDSLMLQALPKGLAKRQLNWIAACLNVSSLMPKDRCVFSGRH